MKPLLTIKEAAAALCCGRTKIFELLEHGVLKRGPKYGRAATVTAKSVQLAADPEALQAKPRAARGSQSCDPKQRLAAVMRIKI